MDILLISLNRFAQPYPVFPLGMAYIAAALEKAGFNVRMCDCNIDLQNIEDIVQESNPDCIGISIRNIDDVRLENNTYFVPELTVLVDRIRKISNAPLVLGGSAYSLFPERLLELSSADFGIIGEGEEAIVSLVRCINRRDYSLASLGSISSLVYRSNNRIIKNDMRIINPANIFQPLRSSRLCEYYIENSAVVNIQTQRGCPFKCCYCTYPLIEGRHVRKRTAVSIVDEIEVLVAAGGDYFFVVDSVFNIDNTHVASFCEEMISRNIACAWSCFLRPRGLTSDLMKMMKRAGLSHIEFGTDSLCDTVLDAYGKKFTFDDVVFSSELARTHDIHYAHFLIAGGPGETLETLKTGFVNSKKIKKTVFFPYIGMRLFPGTPLYQRAIDETIISEKDSCLEPVFYISPSLSHAEIRTLHEEFHSKMPNWVIDDTTDEVRWVIEGLRKKGIRGPLWEFLAR